jgi:hypothetical protein
VHADNARRITAKVTRAFCKDNFLRIAPHSPLHRASGTEIPLAFSCFLFGHLNNRLQGQQFGSADELLSGVRQILDEISLDTLETGFREWVNRLDRCIAALQEMENTWNEVNNGTLSYS